MTAPRRAALITPEEFTELIHTNMHPGADFVMHTEELWWGGARIRLSYSPTFLRPGGTLSGPTMFTLADTALYAAVLSAIGMVPLAVTTDMTLHFLRRPSPVDLLAHAELLKVGGTLMMGEVRLTSAGSPDVVCHATGTYARPPGASRAATPQ
jgi:acyl-coenzyme A thioesterase PaaI-like protein